MLAKIQSHDTILYFCFNLKLKNEKNTIIYRHIFYACRNECPGTRSASYS